jgi:beta-lactamase regulating signal transducer with metallopeptidase domain/5-hydroxyisourate hydrolase-like protein (transthyretin family)
LFTMIAVPAATFAFYAQAGSVLRALMLRIAILMDPTVFSRTAAATALASHHSQWTTWVVYLWFAGVALSSLRIVVGWRLTRRLLQTASDAVPEAMKQTFECMKSRMRLARPVRLLLSERVDGPAAIGWLKPVVLLPLTAITGLDPEQLQAVLAHELAHIRRHDFLVNVLQQCVESLLFYHPAVWWLSRRIRMEREHVCDDLAVAACGDPAVYAKALVALERNRSNVPSMAMAAARGSLKARVRRIFGWTPEGRDWREAATAAMFVLTVLVAVAWQTRTIEAQSMNVHVTQDFAPSIPRSESQPVPGPAAMIATTLASLAPSPAISAQKGAVQNPSAAARAGIQGVVLSAGTGEPISGAQLTVTSAGVLADYTRTTGQIIEDERAFAEGYRAGTQNSARDPLPATDDLGRFTIENLNAGSYRISVVAGGYVRQEYGGRSPDASGSVITLTAGQSLKDLVIRMTPTSTISGLVRSRTGKPAVDVPVQLLRATYNYTGQRITQIVATSRTDDRGEYRLYWVAPGHYFISAGTSPSVGPRGGGAVTGRPTADSAPTATYSMTFYPGVPELSAAGIIEVLPDTPVTADFVVSERSLYKVSGRVVDSSTGKPPASVLLSLVYRNPAGGTDSFASGSSYDAVTGNFELRNVAAGAFNVQAVINQIVSLVPNMSTPANAAKAALAPGTLIPGAVSAVYVMASGSTPITVTNADVSGVVVNIIPTLTIKGKLSMDGSSQAGDLTSLRVQLRPSTNAVITSDTLLPRITPVAADGTFTLNGVTPGEYQFAMSPVPVNYYVKELRFGGTGALNTPINIPPGASETLEVVLSSQVAQVEGTVSDDKGQPAQGVQVVLVPEAHRDRSELFRAVTTGPNGQFTIRGVAPGDYKVFAWESIEAYAYFDPELLKRDEAKGQRIKIQDSDKAAVTVKMIPRAPQ